MPIPKQRTTSKPTFSNNIPYMLKPSLVVSSSFDRISVTESEALPAMSSTPSGEAQSVCRHLAVLMVCVLTLQLPSSSLMVRHDVSPFHCLVGKLPFIPCRSFIRASIIGSQRSWRRPLLGLPPGWKHMTGLLHEGIFHVAGLIKPAIFGSLPWAYVICNWAQILISLRRWPTE